MNRHKHRSATIRGKITGSSDSLKHSSAALSHFLFRDLPFYFPTESPYSSEGLTPTNEIHVMSSHYKDVDILDVMSYLMLNYVQGSSDSNLVLIQHYVHVHTPMNVTLLCPPPTSPDDPEFSMLVSTNL